MLVARLLGNCVTVFMSWVCADQIRIRIGFGSGLGWVSFWEMDVKRRRRKLMSVVRSIWIMLHTMRYEVNLDEQRLRD